MKSIAEQFDVIVVGAGAAGLTAAVVAAARGCSVLLLEHSRLIGGTSAISGGMVWMPANPKMAAIGIADDPGEARRYLSCLVGNSTPERLDAFIHRSTEALLFLEENSSLRLRPVPVYPDYYPAFEGSKSGGRVLEPVPFDGARLGVYFSALRTPLREFMLFGGMMISRSDVAHFRRVGKSIGSTLRVIRLLGAYAMQRLGAPRGRTLYLGNALVARLLKSALDLGVVIRTEASVSELLQRNGSVCGVSAQFGAQQREFGARGGVILATGGISHDVGLRRRYEPSAANLRSATVPNPDAVCGARLAERLKVKMSDPRHGSGLWVPISHFSYRNGSAGYFPHTVTDRGKPGLIALGQDGRRFVNEALSYHEFGLAQLREGERAIPAHLICDAKFLWKYGLGKIRPFSLSIRQDVASGYLKRADTLEALAGQIGVPPTTLVQTVAHYNRFAAKGEDPEFGRGGDIYQRHLGDADVDPNPCVAPITKPPFYSVAVRPGDLGMAAGMATTATAEVLDQTGAPISGLFACGNDMQSVMNGAYPGPGITLGPALTFGYIAATEAARRVGTEVLGIAPKLAMP